MNSTPLTRAKTPDHAIRLFTLTWGAEPTPEQLALLHLPDAPCRESDLLAAIQGWLRRMQHLYGLDFTQTRFEHDVVREVERELDQDSS